MSHLELMTLKNIETQPREIFKSNRLYTIHFVRLSFFFLVNLFVYLLGFTQHQFINSNFTVASMSALSVVFLSSSFTFIFWDRLSSIKLWNFSVIILDAICVCFFIQFSDLVASQFVFLYLAVIIFSGLLLSQSESILISCLVCLLFNLNMVSVFAVEEQNLISFLLNNLSFLITSYLSSSLGVHLSNVGLELQKKETEIEYVKNVNSLIVENISSGIITIDRFGQIFSMNESAKIILGQDGVGKSIKDILNLGEKFKEGKGRLETTVRIADDKKIIEVIHSPLIDGEGVDKGNILLVQDLTRIKKLEYAVKQQDKLAAVGQLAAGIAHEIRNPLASISGSVQLLQDTATDPENLQLFKIIIKEIDRLNDLITEFLEFVRPDNVNEEPMSLNHLIDEVTNMTKMNKQIRQDVSLDTQLMSRRLIHGDAPKLKQALLNIVLNSYQALTEVEVAKISIKTYDENDKVVLVISDTGVGIKSETLDKIFEPFHTTKTKGTGLGLAVTHKILENHKAEVYVESEVGKGTQFSISFPAKGNNDPIEDKIKKIA